MPEHVSPMEELRGQYEAALELGLVERDPVSEIDAVGDRRVQPVEVGDDSLQPSLRFP